MDEVFGFRDSIRDRDPGYLKVDYPDGGGADVYAGVDAEIAHIGFGHFGGDTFFEALYQLADRTKSVVYWPGRAPSSAITDPVMLQHVPKYWEDAVGPPQLVRNGVELWRCWHVSTSIKRSANEP